jgi:hypothetical protein
VEVEKQEVTKLPDVEAVLHLTRISVTVRVIVQLDELEELDDFEVDVEVLESEVLV